MEENEERSGINGWLDEHRIIVGFVFILVGIVGLVVEYKTRINKVSHFQIVLVIICFAYGLNCIFGKDKIKWF